jgi:MarR family transcriptional regulator, lower aerobic nicotinate degradation pathway regulator
MDTSKRDSAGAWAKRLYLTSRTVLEECLRPYDLGSTQYQILWLLAKDGPQAQRNLLDILQVEKPTLSGVIAALVRKGLVEQTPDPSDQRQKQLALTPAGLALWRDMPDLAELILTVAFEGVDETELATVVRVLRTATERLLTHMKQGKKT